MISDKAPLKQAISNRAKTAVVFLFRIIICATIAAVVDIYTFSLYKKQISIDNVDLFLDYEHYDGAMSLKGDLPLHSYLSSYELVNVHASVLYSDDMNNTFQCLTEALVTVRSVGFYDSGVEIFVSMTSTNYKRMSDFMLDALNGGTPFSFVKTSISYTVRAHVFFGLPIVLKHSSSKIVFPLNKGKVRRYDHKNDEKSEDDSKYSPSAVTLIKERVNPRPLFSLGDLIPFDIMVDDVSTHGIRFIVSIDKKNPLKFLLKLPSVKIHVPAVKFSFSMIGNRVWADRYRLRTEKFTLQIGDEYLQFAFMVALECSGIDKENNAKNCQLADVDYVNALYDRFSIGKVDFLLDADVDNYITKMLGYSYAFATAAMSKNQHRRALFHVANNVTEHSKCLEIRSFSKVAQTCFHGDTNSFEITGTLTGQNGPDSLVNLTLAHEWDDFNVNASWNVDVCGDIALSMILSATTTNKLNQSNVDVVFDMFDKGNVTKHAIARGELNPSHLVAYVDVAEKTGASSLTKASIVATYISTPDAGFDNILTRIGSGYCKGFVVIDGVKVNAFDHDAVDLETDTDLTMITHVKRGKSVVFNNWSLSYDTKQDGDGHFYLQGEFLFDNLADFFYLDGASWPGANAFFDTSFMIREDVNTPREHEIMASLSWHSNKSTVRMILGDELGGKSRLTSSVYLEYKNDGGFRNVGVSAFESNISYLMYGGRTKIIHLYVDDLDKFRVDTRKIQSSAPTSHPTVLSPSPSHSPTLMPTINPTRCPTVSPTLAPISSPPTVFGATGAPTIPSKPPPELDTCRYADDGSYILVTLNGPSDKGRIKSPHICDNIFDFPGSTSASCSWISDGTSLSIYPSPLSETVIRIGSYISLRPYVLRSACPLFATALECIMWPAAPFQRCLVMAPNAKVLPKVAITAPTVIGPCDNFVLALGASSGSAGRNWNMTVGVNASQPLNLKAIRDFYRRSYSMDPPTALPHELLAAGLKYEFTVTLCNFFGWCGVKSHYLEVLDIQVPYVTIAGNSARQIKRNQMVSLLSEASVNSCDGTKSSAGLTYSWLVFENNSPVAVYSTSLSPSKFTLPPYSLKTSHTYIIQLTVMYNKSPQTSSFHVSIEVISGFISAVIQGATSRSLQFGDTIQLDASRSKDDNVDRLTGSAAGLVFQWKCDSFTTLGDSRPCTLALATVTGSPDKVRIQLIQQGQGDVYSRITVNVTDAGKIRYALASVVVYESAPASPKLSVSASATKIIASDKVNLFATVALQTSTTAQWLVSDTTLNLASQALTPTKATFPAGTHNFNLVLDRNTLYSGTTFTFSLVAGSSVSTIDIYVVRPPVIGKFEVIPAYGNALDTLFTMVASRWQETELPITYSFGYMTAMNSFVSLQSRSETSFVKSILAYISDAPITCMVTGFNALNAYSAQTSEVLVKRVQVDVADIKDLVTSSLASGELQPTEINRVVAIAATTLNSVNCSLSPDCAALNREDCLSTAHTCGACIREFIGDSGDSNSRCYTKSNLPSAYTAALCQSDKNCVSSTQYCDRHGQCAYYAKTCLLDCSGHGRCRSQDIATGSYVDSCFVNDVSCAAVCDCSNEYFGTSCAISRAEIDSRKQARYQMISAIQNTSTTIDVTRESILEQVNLISELAVSSVELTYESCTLLVDMLATILSNADTFQIGYDSLLSTYEVADTCAVVLEKHRSTTNSNPQQSPGIISRYLELVTSNLVVGQDAAQFILSRTRSSAAFQNALSGFSVDIPLSDWERALGMQSSSVNMSGITSEALSSTLSVRAVESTPRSYTNGSFFNSNPLQIEITKTGSAAQNLNKVIIVLQSRDIHEYGTLNSSHTNFTTACEEGEVAWHNHSCPQGGQVAHKCIGYAGVINSPCPSITLVPICPVLIDGRPVVDDSCTVIDYTSTTTTCECAVQEKASRRLADGDTAEETYETSGGVEVVSMTLYSYDEFVETIYETQSIKVSDLKNAILVICMFAVMWFIGLLAMFVDVRQTVRPKVAKERVKRHRSSATMFNSVSGDVASSVEQRKRYLKTYLDSIFPVVFRESKSGLQGAWEEIKKHHRYANLFTAHGPTSTQDRARAIVHLLTVQTMLMFFMAVFYDLEYPTDNGACSTYTSQSKCLSKTSIFDSSKTLCQWKNYQQGDGSYEYQCIYVHPTATVQVVILISIFIACGTAPVNTLVDYVFEIISAPSADEHKMKTESNLGNTKHGNVGRRMSQALRRMSEAVSATAASATERVVKRKTTSFILEETTRVVPDSVIRSHALAQSALGQSLIEALAKRQTFVSCDLGANLRASGGEWTSDVESGSPRTSRYLRRIHSIVSAALPSSDSIRSTSILPISPVETSETAWDDQNILAQLSHDIQSEYDLLPISEQADFAEAWSWDPERKSFISRDISLCDVMCGRKCNITEQAVSEELRAIQTEFETRMGNLETATDVHVGLEIMHLFMCDLLGWGSPAQKIFETKTQEEFRESIVVTPIAKKLAWTVIILTNLFFVYFSILRGMTREYAWQKGYVIACAIQVVVEVLLYESSEVLWVHYVIPQLVSNDVNYILKHLQQTIDVAFSSNPEPVNALDMSSYFFLSSKLAEKFSYLFESAIVLSYHSRMPPVGSKVGLKWKHVTDSEIEKQLLDIENETLYRFSVLIRRFSVLVFLGNVLKQIGTVPMRLQQLLLHTIQPLIMSFIVIGGRYIAMHGMISGLVGALLVIEFSLFTLGYYAKKRYDGAKNQAEHNKWLTRQELAKQAAEALAATNTVRNNHNSVRDFDKCVDVQPFCEFCSDEEISDHALGSNKKLNSLAVTSKPNCEQSHLDVWSESSDDSSFSKLYAQLVLDDSSNSDNAEGAGALSIEREPGNMVSSDNAPFFDQERIQKSPSEGGRVLNFSGNVDLSLVGYDSDGGNKCHVIRFPAGIDVKEKN